MSSETPFDVHQQTLTLQLASAAVRHLVAGLRADSEQLIRQGHDLRDRIRQLLNPPPRSTN